MGVETLNAGPWELQVWQIARYDTQGRDLGIVYSLELRADFLPHSVVIEEGEIHDLLEILTEGVECVRRRMDECTDAVAPVSSPHAA